MSGNPALNRTIKNALYQLKLRYGAPISVYRLTSASTNLKTGVRTNTKESLTSTWQSSSRPMRHGNTSRA